MERLGGVDWVIPCLFGAVLGALWLGPKLGRAALGWGLLWAMIPELDRLILPFLDTAWDMKVVRGFTHSVVVMTGVSVLLARWLVPRWKREKVTLARGWGAIFSVLMGHGFVDACSVDGAWLGWPLGGHVSFAVLPAFDLVLAVILLVTVVMGWRVSSGEWKKGGGRKTVGIGLAIGLAYVGGAFWVKSWVRGELSDDLERRGITWERAWQAPEGGSLFLWRGLIEREGEIWVGYRSVFDGDVPVAWTIYSQGDELGKLAEAFEVQAVQKRSGGWCLTRRTRRGVWMVDMRVMAQREWDERGVALRPGRAWEYQVNGRGDVLKATLRGGREWMVMNPRVVARMFGDDEDWDDRPRLIGNPGVSQSYLSVLR